MIEALIIASVVTATLLVVVLIGIQIVLWVKTHYGDKAARNLGHGIGITIFAFFVILCISYMCVYDRQINSNQTVERMQVEK